MHAASRSQRSAEAESSVRWWQVDMTKSLSCTPSADHGRAQYHLPSVRSLSGGSGLRARLADISQSLGQHSERLDSGHGDWQTHDVVLAPSLTEPEAGRKEPTPGSPYAAAKWAAGGYARMFHRLYQLPVVLVQTVPDLWARTGRTKDHSVRDSLAFARRGPKTLEWKSTVRLDLYRRRGGWTDRGQAKQRTWKGPPSTSVPEFLYPCTTLRIALLVWLVLRRLRYSVHEPTGPWSGREWLTSQDAHAKLGWRPTVPLEAGLKKTVEWYRRHVSASSTSTETATSRLTAPSQSFGPAPPGENT